MAKCFLLLLCLILLPGMPAAAQDKQASPDPGKPAAAGPADAESDEAKTAALAKAAQNPIADLISFPLQNNTAFGIGPYERAQNELLIESQREVKDIPQDGSHSSGRRADVKTPGHWYF